MITTDRLDELETLMPDTPDDARISIPARDLRDLVALIPVVRAAIEWNPEGDYGVVRLSAAVDKLREQP